MYINPGLTIKIMAAAKKQTKADLENKIAELEAKLNQLSTQLESKPAEVKPAETKPAEVKPAETKPKGTLPKGMDTKPEAAKPAERPAATTKPKGTLPKGFEEKPNQKVHYLKDLKRNLQRYQNQLKQQQNFQLLQLYKKH
jgi:hypothetical protein